jgi:hypothetical protein
MAVREPKNEQAICKAVMSLLAHRRGERIVSAQPIDTVIRDAPAIEWVFGTPTANFALEHRH